jgi:hypothetical protein
VGQRAKRHTDKGLLFLARRFVRTSQTEPEQGLHYATIWIDSINALACSSSASSSLTDCSSSIIFSALRVRPFQVSGDPNAHVPFSQWFTRIWFFKTIDWDQAYGNTQCATSKMRWFEDI